MKKRGINWIVTKIHLKFITWKFTAKKTSIKAFKKFRAKKKRLASQSKISKKNPKIYFKDFDSYPKFVFVRKLINKKVKKKIINN